MSLVILQSAPVESSFEVVAITGYLGATDIRDFYTKEIRTYLADPTFKDFVLGLEHHTYKSISEMQLETMRSRLMRKIASVL